jgi:hypothetical protein
MFNFAQHEPLDSAELADFFARWGWSAPQATLAVEWAIAAAEDWVTCTVDGELVGFGRTCLLDGYHRLAFDLVVDERFRGFGVDLEILRRLAGSVQGGELTVFRTLPSPEASTGHPSAAAFGVPDAPPGAYLG